MPVTQWMVVDLPGAVWPEKTEEIPRRHVERKLFDADSAAAIDLAQMGNRKGGDHAGAIPEGSV